MSRVGFLRWAAAFTRLPLKYMQKDMRLAIALGDQLEQPLPTAAITNGAFKQAIEAGFADEDITDEDIAAVYKVIK
ncbi:3-hydroxyisobutyrate dehydrogenase/2-hydroxy-3-oxopropionate reductase [Marinomonas polaris DSM 16579]|uniref:3-hydroxyisobutyrate dehydrogenase/2-hydroxy-3-oxopropionate reductase n=1 Tax=Marinomonas polaris DSM 16579 TaxID=1122206 RepID=A0A1M5CJK8_9GAMM|nr:hypothetical protein [Marinomonas polaris]SHF54899.1 3-hydroxyisobutyrate dehydrogenase/2-hydroxy-3-oxopropionate reductase [Marinomonas polaris DSM 16579]